MELTYQIELSPQEPLSGTTGTSAASKKSSSDGYRGKTEQPFISGFGGTCRIS